MAFNDYIAKELTDNEKLLLNVVQMAYQKHYMRDNRISRNELGDNLHRVLSVIMDDDYLIWLKKTKFRIDHSI